MSSHKMLIQDVIEAAADQDDFVARIRDDPQKLQVRTTDELPLAIVRYNKKYSNMEDPLVRECRSVVVSKSPLRVVCWSPPKSGEMPEDMGGEDWENVSQSEFVDGTMVNVFFQESDMWISTRSYLHATCRFYSSRTFAELFYETMGTMNLDFGKVPKDICMTFILKHPENRIVQQHARPGLVLVAAAKLVPENGHVEFLDISDIRNKQELTCWYPRQYQFMNPQKVREYCLQPTLPPNFQGIMVTTKSGARQKFRNPTQNYVRLLRGNNRRMDYRFIQLLKDDRVMEYLKQFREERNEMWELRKKIQEVWRGVFAAYRDVFITRTKKVPEVKQEQRPVIIEIHTHWKDVLRVEGKRVNYAVVRDFITAYPVPKQLFLMNYGNRESEEGDEILDTDSGAQNVPENHEPEPTPEEVSSPAPAEL